MCQHCCRMEWTPCAPIPYACPLCPVRQVADLCGGSNKGECRRRYAQRKSIKRADNQLCRGISELYTHVVAAKRNVKSPKRSGRKSLLKTANDQTGTEIRLLPRMATDDAGRPQRQAVKFRLDHTQYIDNNIPVPYREPVTDPNWTWAARYPVAEKVLPVHARMNEVASPPNTVSPCRFLSSPYD